MYRGSADSRQPHPNPSLQAACLSCSVLVHIELTQIICPWTVEVAVCFWKSAFIFSASCMWTDRDDDTEEWRVVATDNKIWRRPPEYTRSSPSYRHARARTEAGLWTLCRCQESCCFPFSTTSLLAQLHPPTPQLQLFQVLPHFKRPHIHALILWNSFIYGFTLYWCETKTSLHVSLQEYCFVFIVL